MSIQLWIIIICGIILYNMYYETNIMKLFNNYKKMYKMAIVVLFGLGAIRIINMSPKMSYDNMDTLNTFIKLMGLH